MKIEKLPTRQRMRRWFVGRPRDPGDKSVFQKITLVAFFAWIGLGSDGISSSCYGPSEAFLELQSHPFLAIFVALGTVITIFVISGSYSQIIELFPHGGGGYHVASRLISPTVGMISGCALVVDYLLTITLSIASGAEAIFSFLPPSWFQYRLEFALIGVIALTVLNLRGVKESILPLVPIFLIFIATHLFAIVFAFVSHFLEFPHVANEIASQVQQSSSQLGVFGMFVLILRSYSMGAGTFTGLEAVSNGIPVLREPKVHTAKKTMMYMAFSLSFIVLGLMIAYLLYNVSFQEGKTLNAVLFESMVANWNPSVGKAFVWITLFSEGAILFVAAQTGFLDGPRVLSNMAADRWMPSKFTMLSDRLVTQNGILIMGGAAFVLMALSKGSVGFLLVLYSINVFITFTLSQLGMVRHWWSVRKKVSTWWKKITINGIGLILTSFILIAVSIIKFDQGGWITLLVTGSLVTIALLIKRHYTATYRSLGRLDSLVEVADTAFPGGNNGSTTSAAQPELDPNSHTAVILVNGYNGLGMHLLFNTIRMFGQSFRNFVFVQVGVIDTGTFKGVEQIEAQRRHIKEETERYVTFMNKHGFYAEAFYELGTDVAEEILKITPKIEERFSNIVFFGGKVVFSVETFASRLLHNNYIFEIQRRLYHRGIPLVVLPIRV